MLRQTHIPGERIAVLREELRTALAEATSLIETAPDSSAEAWFAFSERLQDACWNLAAATNRPSEPDTMHTTSNARHGCGIRRWRRR